MTRTTELLKEIHNELEKGIKRNGVLPLDWAMDRIEPIIEKGLNRGRLDALKEKEKFILRLIEIENKHNTDIHLPHLVDLELASIQEEIKLIESAGVGK